MIYGPPACRPGSGRSVAGAVGYDLLLRGPAGPDRSERCPLGDDQVAENLVGAFADVGHVERAPGPHRLEPELQVGGRGDADVAAADIGDRLSGADPGADGH